MTVFNPQGPDVQVPEWTNVSKPISEYKGDTSTGIALNSAADVLTSVVKVTDNAFRESIKKDVTEGVDKLRDGFTDALINVRNQQMAQADPSLLPQQPTQQPPQQLQSGLERVKQMGTAMAQSGSKINDTLYTGSLNALAKQLRNQYPGYRDYIDEQIQSVSGVNPANAFYKNLMEDINRNSEANKTETNATLSMLRDLTKEGFRDKDNVQAAQVYEAFRAGRIDVNQVNKWVSSAKSVEWNRAQRSADRKDRIESDADAAVSAQKDLSKDTAEGIAHSWQTMTIGKNTDTMAKLATFIQQNAGNSNVMDERSQAIGQQMQALRNAAFKQAFDHANEGGSNSLVAKLGGDPEKAKKVIEGQFAVWDNAIQAVYNKDWGAAYSHMNFNKAIAADSTNLLYNAPQEDVRKYNRMVGAINTISPQAASEFFKNSLISPVPMNQKEFLKNLKMEVITQPGKEVGSLTSIDSAIQTVKSKAGVSPQTNSELINTVQEINNPKFAEEHRVNVARAFFDPQQNGKLLRDENFKKDYYDPATRRTVPGKYAVFTRLSADSVAQGISELNRNHPELVPMYRDTMSRNFGEQLFSREIRDLGQANEGVTATSPFKIKFVNDNGQAPRFAILDQNNREMTMTEAGLIPIGVFLVVPAVLLLQATNT